MKIVFMSKRQAEELHPSNNACIISMCDPGESVHLREWENRIIIECDDYDPEELLSIGRQDILRTAKLFNKMDASEIMTFVASLPSNIDTIYVHCHAGASRSAAVATFIGEMLDVEVFQESRRSNPNMHIYDTMKIVYEGEV